MGWQRGDFIAAALIISIIIIAVVIAAYQLGALGNQGSIIPFRGIHLQLPANPSTHELLSQFLASSPDQVFLP